MVRGTYSSVTVDLDATSSWFFEQVATIGRYETPGHGQSALIERVARAGSMPPLHRRDEDESYRVLEGKITFFVGGEEICAQAGDVVVAPRDVPRTFLVESDSARWLVLTRVRALDRYHDFCRAVAPAAHTSGWPSPDEHATVTAIAEANGIELLGPPGVLPELKSRNR